MTDARAVVDDKSTVIDGIWLHSPSCAGAMVEQPDSLLLVANQAMKNWWDETTRH